MSETYRFPELGPFQTPYAGREIVYWEDERSLQWLARTVANKSFSSLARFYEAQSDKFMCGPASLSMVLNALLMESGRILPYDLRTEEYVREINPNLPENYRASFARFTQKNIFDCGPRVKPINEIYCGDSPGLNLREMQQILVNKGLRCERVPVHSAELGAHIDNLSHALSTAGHYVIANFDRAVWGVQGNGHVSPIGALDAISRRVLVMDVNMCGRWLWIDLELLLQSMASPDGHEPRGYLLISHNSGA